MDTLKWWGYRHTDGNLFLKQYRTEGAFVMAEAKDSPFVDEMFGPFEAESRIEAEIILKAALAKKVRP